VKSPANLPYFQFFEAGGQPGDGGGGGDRRPRRRRPPPGGGGVMAPFTTVTGIAAPLIRDDINTDEITPIQIARTLGLLTFNRGAPRPARVVCRHF
jgi:hypothetical protein